MNMQHARAWVERALNEGLRLHGVSAAGKPAISFDFEQPGAEQLRRQFNATKGLVREQLRAAMIDACRHRGLPTELPALQDVPQLVVRPAKAEALH